MGREIVMAITWVNSLYIDKCRVRCSSRNSAGSDVQFDQDRSCPFLTVVIRWHARKPALMQRAKITYDAIILMVCLCCFLMKFIYEGFRYGNRQRVCISDPRHWLLIKCTVT